MGHTSGLRSGAHCGMVRFALACSGPHWEVVHGGTLPDRFGTSMVRLRNVQAPLWRGMVRVRHALKEHFNVPLEG